VKSWLFLGLILTLTALGQQPETTQAGTTEAKKPGILQGRVVNAKTGEAIRRVNLTLRPIGAMGVPSPTIVLAAPGGMPSASPYAASTDAEGKFRIENVEPGNYMMMAERQGFVRTQYGARRNSMMGTTIKVAPAQETNNLDIKMAPQAVITGRVLDDEGEPLANVQIQALQRRFFGGKQQMAPMGGGQTLDTGEYRVANLAPGRYWISAIYRARMMMFGEGPARNTAGQPEEEYVPTYYPDTTDRANARPIDVSAGQEVPGIDIRLQKARVFRIRGKVVAGGQPPRNMRLVLMPRERSGMMGFMGGPGAMVKEDGSFEMGHVQPGSYFVTALPMPGVQNMMGKVAVDVAQGDVDNVALVLGSGSTVKGGIRIDGDTQQLEQAQGKKITFGGVRVQFSPMEGMAFNNSGTLAKDDGFFMLENVAPDKYRVVVFNLPQGTWLKSIRAGDQEVLDNGMDLSGGAPAAVQITLGVGPGQISGIVENANKEPASGSMVTLLPDPMQEDRNYLYRVASTDQDGQFTLQGIPPGEYKLFAWEDIEPGSYMDPEFLKPHDSRSQKITIKENSQQQVKLAQVPADATAGVQ
jgi:Carboxypeptidase regulatory-like domain